MPIVVLATVPTEAVVDGFLPAAHDLGLPVLLLTDGPEAWPCLDAEIRGCAVHDPRAVLDLITQEQRPLAVFSNSDHLQVTTALVADYLGLPGKDWRAALRGKDKALMRRALADAGVDPVWARSLKSGEPLPTDLPLPAVVKPRSGVASEDVSLASTALEVSARVAEVAARSGRAAGAQVLVEEYLDGPLHTLETLGDGQRLRVLGGFRTTLGTPPTFVEERLDWCPDLPAGVEQQVLDQISALGVGFGACHTEFILTGGRARLVEVNYRMIGDSCEFLLADLLGEPLFEQVLQLHLGEPLPNAAESSPGHARVDYPCADRSGVLVEAPDRMDLDGTVRLAYRPMRSIGERRELTGTNRDYLGAVRAVGPDRETVDRTVERFLAEQTWRVAA